MSKAINSLQNSDCRRECERHEEILHAERATAATGRLYGRVVEFKARALQRLDAVHFHAIEVQDAGLVDEQTQPVLLVGFCPACSADFRRPSSS
jgi:hypothetical protein